MAAARAYSSSNVMISGLLIELRNSSKLEVLVLVDALFRLELGEAADYEITFGR